MPSASASEKDAGVWRNLVRAVSRRNTFRPVLGGRDLIFARCLGLLYFARYLGMAYFAWWYSGVTASRGILAR